MEKEDKRSTLVCIMQLILVAGIIYLVLFSPKSPLYGLINKGCMCGASTNNNCPCPNYALYDKMQKENPEYVRGVSGAGSWYMKCQEYLRIKNVTEGLSSGEVCCWDGCQKSVKNIK